MKATGIVRRIDDLGRVVIPKEIRRTMRIREGDPLEIYTDVGGEVIFKKYSPIGEMGSMAMQYVEALNKVSGIPAVITDRDRIIAVSGTSKKDLIDRKISPGLEELIENRQNYIYSGDNEKLYLVSDKEKQILVCFPIISSGDICGSVVLLCDEGTSKAGETEIKLTSTAALFLSKQME